MKTPSEFLYSLRIRSYGAPPKEGTRVSVLPGQLLRDEDGNLVGEARCDDVVSGTIVRVGAHWSDQPNGQSGWWVTVELDEAPTMHGRPLTPDEIS